MNADDAIRRKRLMFQSHHMGTAENDLMFGTFAERHLAELSSHELDQYDALLAENDSDLYKWVTGKESVPTPHNNRVMDLLKTVKETL